MPSLPAHPSPNYLSPFFSFSCFCCKAAKRSSIDWARSRRPLLLLLLLPTLPLLPNDESGEEEVAVAAELGVGEGEEEEEVEEGVRGRAGRET